MTLRFRYYHRVLLVMVAFLSKRSEGGQLTCMNGAVVKQNKSGQQYCDCSAVMARDILAGKLCEHQATQFCLYGGTGASSSAFCTNGGTCKSVNYNQNQVHPGCDCINNHWGPHCEYSQDELYSATNPTATSTSTTPPSIHERKFDNPEGFGAVIFAALVLVVVVIAFLIHRKRSQKKSVDEESVVIPATEADLDPDGSSTMQGATLITTEQMKSVINNNDRVPPINYAAFDDNDGILGPPTVEEVINRGAFDANDGILGPPTNIDVREDADLQNSWSPPTQKDFPQALVAQSISTDDDEEFITFSGTNKDEFSMTSSPTPVGRNSFAIDSDDSPLTEEDQGIFHQEGDEEQPPSNMQPSSHKFAIDYETLNAPESTISPKGSVQSPTRAVVSSPTLASPNAPSPGLFPDSPSTSEIV